MCIASAMNGDMNGDLSIEHAKKLYKKSNTYDTVLPKRDKHALDETILKLLTKFSSTVTLKSVFKYGCFLDVIEQTIAHGKFDGEKSSQAFSELEKYLKLVFDHPWKTEYQVLKQHSGFFNAKIKSHLSNPELIFMYIGYRRDEDSQLILREKPNREFLFDMCFECLISTVSCKRIEAYYTEIKDRGGDLKDAFEFCLTGLQPNVEYLKLKLDDKLKNKKEPLNIVQQRDQKEIDNLTRDARDQREIDNLTRDARDQREIDNLTRDARDQREIDNYSRDARLVVNLSEPANHRNLHEDRDDIPFIDDNVYSDNSRVHFNQKGTLDDHINASFREVNLKQERKNLQNPTGWEFMDTKHPKDDTLNLSKTKSSHEIDLKSRKIKSEAARHHRDKELRSTNDYLDIGTEPRSKGAYKDIGRELRSISDDFTSAYPATKHDNGYSMTLPNIAENRKKTSSRIYPSSREAGLFSSTQEAELSKRKAELSKLEAQIILSKREAELFSLKQEAELFPSKREAALTDFQKNYQKPNISANNQQMIELDGLSFTSGYYDGPMNTSDLCLESLPSYTDYDVWNCLYCSTLNDTTEIACKTCSKSRNPGPDLDNPKAGDRKKVCTKCTFENLPLAEICDVCGHKLKTSNVQTYV